ncbi:hypothetical protein NKI79_30625 [Mesorhizobium sp. M0340]|uniref:hypothetical protein n=1 Tax=Mesorhizobium sp. M0340 TaxID=2956939 RepID=UPI00333A5BD5
MIIHNVNTARAVELVKLLEELARGRVRADPSNPTGCDMVCNATPMGMAGGDPLGPELLASSMFVGDVISGHGLTPFLPAARAACCQTADGDQMVDAVQGIMVDFLRGKETAPMR